MLLKLYRWFTILAGPLIDLYLINRRRRGKEDSRRFSERLGHAGFPRPAGKLVWIHAASVGEAVSILPLMRAILDEYENINILLTTGTVTSSSLLEGKLPARAFHQFVPIDKIVTVRRFLAHWKPDLALFVESELWPNLVIETSRTKCPLLLINARISKDSFETWKRARSMAEKMLSCFALTLAQSDDDKKRLELLGAHNVRCVGNLKFDAPALPADPKETGRLLNQIGERVLWFAASTHEGEDAIIADIHSELRESHEGLLTIIAPRHPERGEQITAECEAKGLRVALRSKGATILDTTDIYIADSIGELGLFYRFSGITFMGGSLVKHGGQNPLEAARLESAILTGPHTQNFARIYDELIQAEACVRVRSKEEMVEEISRLLTDYDRQKKLSKNALELVKSKAGALKNFLEETSPYLRTLTRNTTENNAEDS